MWEYDVRISFMNTSKTDLDNYGASPKHREVYVILCADRPMLRYIRKVSTILFTRLHYVTSFELTVPTNRKFTDIECYVQGEAKGKTNVSVSNL